MAVQDTVRGFFGNALEQEGVEDGDSLLMAGLIDSLKMEELIAFLEKEFGIEIDEDEMLPDNFDSIEAIVSFLEEKQTA